MCVLQGSGPVGGIWYLGHKLMMVDGVGLLSNESAI